MAAVPPRLWGGQRQTAGTVPVSQVGGDQIEEEAQAQATPSVAMPGAATSGAHAATGPGRQLENRTWASSLELTLASATGDSGRRTLGRSSQRRPGAAPRLEYAERGAVSTGTTTARARLTGHERWPEGRLSGS